MVDLTDKEKKPCFTYASSPDEATNEPVGRLPSLNSSNIYDSVSESMDAADSNDFAHEQDRFATEGFSSWSHSSVMSRICHVATVDLRLLDLYFPPCPYGLREL